MRMAGKRRTASGFTDLSTRKRHNGSEFVDVTTAKRYDGAAWQDLFAPATFGTVDRAQSFEGGTAGTAVTPDNSGGGTTDWAFDFCDSGTGVPQYSTAQAAHGTQSATFTGSTSQKMCWWDDVTTGTGVLYARAYLRVAAYPANTWRFLAVQSSGFSATSWVGLNDTDPGPGGSIALENANTAHLTGGVSNTIVALDTWYRIEVKWDTAAHTVTARLYEGDSTTLIEEWTGTGWTGTLPNFGIGQSFDTATNLAGNAWLDDVAVGTDNWLGPAT